MSETEIFQNNFWVRCPGGYRFEEDQLLKADVLRAIDELGIDRGAFEKNAEAISRSRSVWSVALNANCRRRDRGEELQPMPPDTVAKEREELAAACLAILKQILTYREYILRELTS